MKSDGGSLVAQFHRLRQTTSVQAYMQEFQEIRILLREDNTTLTEQYFIESFVEGLKEEVGKLVILQKPKSLLEAIEVATHSEELIQLLAKNLKVYPKATLPSLTNQNVKSEGKHPKPKVPPIRRLSLEEMRTRRELR